MKNKIMEIPEYKPKIIKATNKPFSNENYYSQLYKLKVVKNTKVPAQKGWEQKENLFKSIDINNYNVGIATGVNNDLIVLDIDDKISDKLKNGMTLWNEYIAIHGEPQTVKQLTVNGGYHYIFKLSTKSQKTTAGSFRTTPILYCLSLKAKFMIIVPAPPVSCSSSYMYPCSRGPKL